MLAFFDAPFINVCIKVNTVGHVVVFKAGMFFFGAMFHCLIKRSLPNIMCVHSLVSEMPRCRTERIFIPIL